MSVSGGPLTAANDEETGENRRQASTERRRQGRTAATFAVSEASAAEADGRCVHLCLAEDIAIGGITIKHAKGLTHEPRTEVSLRFALPGSTQEIEARGEIVSDARAGRFRRTGVRFVAVRPEHQQLIGGLLPPPLSENAVSRSTAGRHESATFLVVAARRSGGPDRRADHDRRLTSRG